MDNTKRHGWLAWAWVALLTLLLGVLALLQYRWIAEVSVAQRGWLQSNLEARLNLLSATFNERIDNAAMTLFPEPDKIRAMGREAAYAAQYVQWKQQQEPMFQRVALVAPVDGELKLWSLDGEPGEALPTPWPAEWESLRDRLTLRWKGEATPPEDPRSTDLLEWTRFDPAEPGKPEWLVVELDLDYVRNSLLPQLLERYIGERGRIGYDAEVTASGAPDISIFRLSPAVGHRAGTPADASVLLLDARPDPDTAGRGPRAGAAGGRWRLAVWDPKGTLEATVARARRRNMGVSAGILLLIVAVVYALIRFSRERQRLADLQMSFVAGVSHDLRTPLAVIRTAAFNLRGRLANRPEQIDRYGKLIQAESEKLTTLVERVLQFAGANVGQTVRRREPVPVEALIEGSLGTGRVVLEDSGIEFERRVAPNLPPVLADKLALQLALQNLVDNAVKYGTETHKWVGIFADCVEGGEPPVVEIRVADHGPGIPLDEQKQVFDPFFRGRWAVQDQVRGAGLGLNLVKKIVEAHGGTVALRSEPMKGTEIVVRLPAAPPELQDEFSHTVD
ncbi:MAG: sensor histidine kinase [Bryobacteraceae bacterium]